MEASVSVCYGCGAKFDTNIDLVVKHIDHRIKGKGPDGVPIFNMDFTPMYILSSDNFTHQTGGGESGKKFKT